MKERNYINIRVTPDTWLALTKLKIMNDLKTLDDVVISLLKDEKEN